MLSTIILTYHNVIKHINILIPVKLVILKVILDHSITIQQISFVAFSPGNITLVLHVQFRSLVDIQELSLELVHSIALITLVIIVKEYQVALPILNVPTIIPACHLKLTFVDIGAQRDVCEHMGQAELVTLVDLADQV